jgi:hypothetical protein
MKDEGERKRKKDELKPGLPIHPSSFILHPSSLSSSSFILHP